MDRSGSRMKGKKEHRVPLSDAAIAILKEMHTIRQSDYVFPGNRNGRPIGENTVGRAGIKLVEDGGFTTHGLRSTFRDWAAECTSFPNEVVEMALAHAIPSAVEKAYRRGDLFAKRVALMQAWADYCGGNQADNVVPIRGVS
jgi:integrase